MRNKKLVKRHSRQNDKAKENDILYFADGVRQTIVTETNYVPMASSSFWDYILKNYKVCGE